MYVCVWVCGCGGADWGEEGGDFRKFDIWVGVHAVDSDPPVGFIIDQV